MSKPVKRRDSNCRSLELKATTRVELCQVCCSNCSLFLKIGQCRPLFRYFFLFLHDTIQIEKSVDGVHGTRTRAAVWKVQTNSLSYGGIHCSLLSKLLDLEVENHSTEKKKFYLEAVNHCTSLN